jgi:acyl dehydratase
MLSGYTFATVPQFIGDELGVSDWVLVDQERIQTFADCTGDQQWIHTDVERCQSESPFQAPIAHGLLSLSLVPGLLMEVGAIPTDVSRVVNAGFSNVRFKAPVRSGKRVRVRVKLASAEPKTEGRLLSVLSVVLEVENERDPALSADMIVMLVP